MMITTSTRVNLSLIFGVTLYLAGCGDDTVSTGDDSAYRATIVRTEYGVPHITANDWGSLGFGEAYASAQDQLCNMAWALLQAQGESAAHLGPGLNGENIARDVVVKALKIPAAGKQALGQQSANIRAWIEGYAAGYNQYLTDNSANQPGAWCAGEHWVVPVQPDAFMAQYVMLVHTLPRVAKAVAGARLPEPDTAAAEEPSISRVERRPTQSNLELAHLEGLRLEGMGSNAWALAANRSENGRGLLLANPITLGMALRAFGKNI